MSKTPLISTADARAAIAKMTAELTDRAQKFRRLAVQTLAESVLDDIKRLAPDDDDVPEGYMAHLEVASVTGRPASFAIVYTGKPYAHSIYEPERTVLYVKILRKDDKRPIAELFRALKALSPFTFDTLPLEVPRDTAFLVARKVSKDEVQAIRVRQQRRKADIDRIVARAGAMATSMRAFDINRAVLFNDLGFQILRKEAGFGVKKQAHWTPAVQKGREGRVLKTLEASDASVRLWNDPNYRGWQKAGTIELSIPESTVDDLDDFQKQLIKRAGT